MESRRKQNNEHGLGWYFICKYKRKCKILATELLNFRVWSVPRDQENTVETIFLDVHSNQTYW